MICSVLLLITLTSCVSGAISVLSYRGEENHNITLEWPFPVIIDRSPISFTIYCEMFTDEKPMIMFHLREGVKYPQDEHFAGRVHCDNDVLRKGLVRLQLSGLRADDAGDYNCQVVINTDVTFSELRLNVTAAKDRPKPEEPEASSGGWISLYCLLVLLAAALLSGVSYLLFIHCRRRRKDEEKMMPSSSRGSVETFQSVP